MRTKTAFGRRQVCCVIKTRKQLGLAACLCMPPHASGALAAFAYDKFIEHTCPGMSSKDYWASHLMYDCCVPCSGALQCTPKRLAPRCVLVKCGHFAAAPRHGSHMARLVTRRRAAVYNVPPRLRLQRVGRHARRFALQHQGTVCDERMIVHIAATWQRDHVGQMLIAQGFQWLLVFVWPRARR